jgi:hypothetical protein
VGFFTRIGRDIALISGLQRNTLEKTLGAQAHVTLSVRDDAVLPARPPEPGSHWLAQAQPRAQRPRSIVNWQAMVPVLEALPGVAAVSPMVAGAGLALRGEASGEGHGMLFRDAHIERAFGVCGGEFVDTRPAGHGSRNCADFGVGFRQLGQRFAEHILVGRRAATGAFVLLAGNDVEFYHAMIFVGSRFGRGIAFALLRDDMD